MDRVTIETLKHQLQEKARECYRNGKPDQGDMIWSTFDVLEAWERQGLPGELPVDVAQFELATPSTEQIEAWGEHLREQFRREAQAAKARGNSTTAADKWRELLTIDPNDGEAQRELQWHAEAAADQPQRKMLNDLRRKANSELISDLDEALRLARDLLTSTVLDDASQQEVEKLESQARNKRSVLEVAMGEVETLAAAGMLRKAIAGLEVFLNQGRFEFADRDGSIVRTSDKLRELNEEYALFCTQQTAEYIERAETSLPWFPKSALSLLDQAWNSYDRAEPSLRDKLEQRRVEVCELITRWETAQNLVGQAAKETDPQQRLGLYIEAQSQYDGLFNIKELIEETKRDAVNAVILHVKNIHAAAQLSLNQGHLEKAQQQAMQARERATQVQGTSADLELELAKIDQLMSDIAKTAGQQRLADDAAATVGEYLRKHDYHSAEQAVALLPEDVRDLPVVKRLENRIVLARGGNRVYQVAQQRFDKGDFQGVVDLLGVSDPNDAAAAKTGDYQERDEQRFLQLDERSLRLRQCAQAWIHYQEGLTFLDRDPISAELSFELAIGLDDTLKAEAEKHRQYVTEKKAQIAQVQLWQETAQDFIARQDWEQAFSELNKARQVDSPLRSEVSQQWLDVRAKWRQHLLQRLGDLPRDDDEVKEIVNSLRANDLLDSEHQAEVDAIEREYLLPRGQGEAQAGRWNQAVIAWRAYMDLNPEDASGRNALREALREQALAAARAMYAQSRNGTETLNLLDEHLRQKELQSDAAFLALLVRQACQFGDLERAQQYLNLLSFSEPAGSALLESSIRVLDREQARTQGYFPDSQFGAAMRVLSQASALEAEQDYQLAGKMQKRLQRTRDDLDPPGELLALARVVRAVERYLAAAAGVDNLQIEAEDTSAEG